MSNATAPTGPGNADVESLLKFAGIPRPEEYDINQIIFAQGEPADCVFYLRNGLVKETVADSSGKRIVIGLVRPAEFFGESCIMGQSSRRATASAITDCSVIRMRKALLAKMLDEKPPFAASFIASLVSRIGRVEDVLVEQRFNDCERRLARALLLLASYNEQSGTVTVIPKMSQSTLAEMVGISRTTVSVFIDKFKKLGYIDYTDEGLEVRCSLIRVLLR